MRTIRALLVDDRLIRREKLRALLSAEIDLEMVCEAGDGLEAARLTQQLLPDVAVVDARLPDVPAMDVVRSLRQSCPMTIVIVLTMFNCEQTVSAMLKAGARGYPLKDSALVDVVRVIRDAVKQQSILDSAISRQVLS